VRANLFVALATFIGWEHLDVIWPTQLLPEGIPIGADREMEGLLTLGDPGALPSLATPEGLRDDWRNWISLDQRQDSSKCLPIAKQLRDQLVANGRPRRDAGGAVQYWVKLRLQKRLGPSFCNPDGGLEINQALAGIDSIRPVPCSRDVFVAHGFLCPGERRSPNRESQTMVDTADYYPQAAASAGTVGNVHVRVERDATGSPISCRILASSGSDDLDRQTCKLIGTDPYFTREGAGSKGRDITVPLQQRVTWQLP
jgi:TonB family protein